MTLIHLYPVRNINRISEEIDRLFNDFLASDTYSENFSKKDFSWFPRADISENDNEFVLTVELPGVDKDDINIQYEEGVLRIEGERKKEALEDGVSYLREERCAGKFFRKFRINTQIQEDKIEANFKNGLLSIHLPKTEEARPREIKVKAS